MFEKQGTPQPFEVLKMSTEMCEICGKNPATSTINGKRVCDSCKVKLEAPTKE